MERREFLTMAGLTGLVLTAAGTLYSALFARPSPADPAVPEAAGVESAEGGWADGLSRAQRLTIEGLQEELYMLDIEDEAFIRFVDDYDEHKPFPLKARHRVLHKDVQDFLLSTDFFQNGAKENRKIKYVKLYDAVRHPCYNPLRG